MKSWDPGLPRKRLPVLGIKPGHAEGLTCKVKELAGACWPSEQASGGAGVSGPSGAGSGSTGSGSGMAESSLCSHSFIFTTKSQHV